MSGSFSPPRCLPPAAPGPPSPLQMGAGVHNSHVTNTLQLVKHFQGFLVTQACKTIYGMPSGSQALPKPRMNLSHLGLLLQGPEPSLGYEPLSES